ncbi:MAG: ATP synthase F1 subunit gamma [Bdellovibrionales bacterium GWB1_55_8]|nr:MAG: ATP synthase F1 subunit gamma [Bdellovibrionales bacterium GWB1_55_8]
MASIKDLKKRITSVKNTQQTTKAMKMVSAAKLRRAQDAITNQRPYAKRIDALIRQVSAMVESPAKSPLIEREPTLSSEGGNGKKKVLLVLVTSDRGLCGAFNANVIKAGGRWLTAHAADYDSIELAFAGRKGFDFYKTKKVTLGPYWAEVGGKVTFVKARKLADAVIKRYLDGDVDEVKFVYNEFKNVMSQRVVVENFLPLSQPAFDETEGTTSNKTEEPGIFIVKPDLQGVLDQLLSKHFGIQAFRILLESQAGEHGARMSAMENATKNAGEMIRKLTLQYNKQRQAGITKELLEIISGSESQKSSA